MSFKPCTKDLRNYTKGSPWTHCQPKLYSDNRAAATVNNRASFIITRGQFPEILAIMYLQYELVNTCKCGTVGHTVVTSLIGIMYSHG